MTVSAQPKLKKQKKEKPTLEALPDDGHPGNSKFARALGSVDFQTREKGLQALSRWLVRKNDMKEADMMKIWKGLFYCFWHSDKAPVQLELATRLAALLTQLSEESAFLFFTAFMTTMRREWFGIDRLRLDKFLMLIRKFVNQMLGCLKAAKWRADLVQRYADFLRAHVVLPTDSLNAAGVAYHLGDLLLDELRSVADGKALPGAAVAALLAPFGAALAGGEQVVLHRIGEGLFDTLLSELGSPSDDSPYLQNLDIAALAAQLFELGAAPGTRARNRQVLYDLSNSLERLQRKRARVEAGAQAGPSNGEKPAGKGKKQQAAKEQRAAPAAAQEEDGAAAAAAAATANGKLGAAPAAGGTEGKKKRKAADRDRGAPAPQAQQQQQEQDGAVGATAAAGPGEVANGHAPDAQGEKQLLKKGKKQQQPNGTPVASAPVEPEEAPAAADTQEAPVEEAAAKAPKSAAKKASTREPTSGQKAALRAAIAAVAALPDTPAAAAAAEAPKSAKKSALKKAAPAAAAPEPSAAPEALKPSAEADGEGAAPPSAASTPAAAAGKTKGKGTALGKRPAPGSVAKAAPAEAGGAQEDGQGASGAAASKTPAQAGPASARGPAPTTAKKNRVVINLKKNLYFEHGGPVPDPDVRTPPPARAKGGILKKGAKSCPPKMAPSAAAQASAKPQQGAGQQATRVVPQKARRASAALFF